MAQNMFSPYPLKWILFIIFVFSLRSERVSGLGSQQVINKNAGGGICGRQIVNWWSQPYQQESAYCPFRYLHRGHAQGSPRTAGIYQGWPLPIGRSLQKSDYHHGQVIRNPPLDSSYIVGGQPAAPGEFPFAVLIYAFNVSIQCGGSIINPRFVLTARHCCYREVAQQCSREDLLFAGVHDSSRLNTDNWVQMRRSKACHIHSRPSAHTSRDFAIYELPQPFQLNLRVQPVPLPIRNTLLRAGVMCLVVGWGSVRQRDPNDIQRNVRIFQITGRRKGRHSQEFLLRKAQVPLMSLRRCMSLNADVLIDPDADFCAGFDQGGIDSCQGDSGGPLLCPVMNGKLAQMGIVSRGLGCAWPRRPGIYGSVPAIRSWIRQITGS